MLSSVDVFIILENPNSFNDVKWEKGNFCSSFNDLLNFLEHFELKQCREEEETVFLALSSSVTRQIELIII